MDTTVSALTSLGVGLPVLAAPMAGGPTTPALVVAAGRAGSLGLLAGGYKTPDALADQIAEVRGASTPFGVNLFAPNEVSVDPAAFRSYARALQPEAAAYGLDLSTALPQEDDDFWAAKIALLTADPVPLVSFTFGIPDAPVIDRLRAAGTVVVQTVTSAVEAVAAADAGVDLLVVQASAAGGHSGTLTPSRLPPAVTLADLVAEVSQAVSIPLVAAGGIGTAADVARALSAGAQAAMVGTALLLAQESGTSPPYRSALARADRETVVTRAFTGRPARGLRNRFIETYEGLAPLGYPALHHLTSPLRRAATTAGDAELVNLWAGTAYREAVAAPVAEILARLTP